MAKENIKFVVNKMTEIMHTNDCGYAKRISKKNRANFDTYNAALNCFDNDNIKVKFCSFCNPNKFCNKE